MTIPDLDTLPPRFRYVVGDGRALPYPDNTFDLVFSNSVIEHVGSFADQQRFAEEIRRVGRNYWVQTPNRWFPVEPHWITLFLHYFPQHWLRRMVRWGSLRGWIEKPTLEQTDAFLAGIRLLTIDEMRQLFPDAEILTERFFLLPKSFVAMRCKRNEVQAPLPTLNILGTRVAAVNPTTFMATIVEWLQTSEPGCRHICVTGVHGVMEATRAPRVRAAHNTAAACVPDGVPLTWLGRLRGYPDMARVYGPDLMLSILAHSADKGYANYFYGGAAGVADELAVTMTRRFPDLKVAGSGCPPFRTLQDNELSAVAAKINQAKTDIVWIGISTPKQELLMARLAPILNAKLMLGVGAAFDFHTGRVRQAPGWMQRAGLEWLFRLAMEPRRLWRRYFRNNPAFVILALSQVLGLRRYDLAPMEKENHEH